MAEYWSIEGMLACSNKKKKKDKKKDKKDKKDHDKKSKKVKEIKPEENIFVPYSEFLKNGKPGLYIVRSAVEDFKVETYVLKTDDFDFPRVALDKRHESYKDWLKRIIEKNEENLNVNKVLYASMCKQIEIPKGFLTKVVSASKSEDE